MSSTPDCTVIIPVYNAEATVCRAIESVFAGDSVDYSYEVIVVDDGSTDRTVQNIQRLCEKYASLFLIQKENGGVSSARNIGLQNARGHFLYFMDADDELFADALNTVMKRAYETGCDMVIADYETVELSGRFVSRVAPEFHEPLLAKAEIESDILYRFVTGENQGLNSLWNKLYVRRNIIDAGLVFDEKRSHGEDWQFNIGYLEQADSVCYENVLLYRYYSDGTNALKYKKSLFYSYIEGYRTLIRLVRDYRFDQRDALLSYKVMRDMAQRMIVPIKSKEISDSEKREFLRNPIVTDLFKKLSALDRRQLADLSLSRKDKAAFLLLSKGLYNLAVRMI